MKTHPLAGKLKSSCDAVTSTTMFGRMWQTALGAAKSPRHSTDGSTGASQTHSLPGTAVRVGTHDQDQQQQLAANRSFGPDDFPGHQWRQPRDQLCFTIRSKRQTFRQDWRPMEALPDPNSHETVVPAALTRFSSSWEPRSKAELIPSSFCTTVLKHKLYLILFLCVHTQRCREGCFVPVYITYSQDSKLNSLHRTKYLYLACRAIMILQPWTPRSRSHRGQLAYKSNEII